MITLGQEKTQYLQSRPLLMPNTQSLQKLFKIKLHMRQKMHVLQISCFDMIAKFIWCPSVKKKPHNQKSQPLLICRKMIALFR